MIDVNRWFNRLTGLPDEEPPPEPVSPSVQATLDLLGGGQQSDAQTPPDTVYRQPLSTDPEARPGSPPVPGPGVLGPGDGGVAPQPAPPIVTERSADSIPPITQTYTPSPEASQPAPTGPTLGEATDWGPGVDFGQTGVLPGPAPQPSPAAPPPVVTARAADSLQPISWSTAGPVPVGPTSYPDQPDINVPTRAGVIDTTPARPVGPMEPNASDTAVSRALSVLGSALPDQPTPEMPPIVEQAGQGQAVNPIDYSNAIAKPAADALIRSVGADPETTITIGAGPLMAGNPVGNLIATTTPLGQASVDVTLSDLVQNFTNPLYWPGGPADAATQLALGRAVPILARRAPAVAERLGQWLDDSARAGRRAAEDMALTAGRAVGQEEPVARTILGLRGRPVPAGGALEEAAQQGASVPGRTYALGPTPGERYEFQMRVVPLESLIPSHTDALAPNPAFPRALQPRLRERAASQVQIGRIAQQLNPEELLTDFHTLDRGPMIVGPDNVVESGNGRTLALRQLAANDPEGYQRYVDELRFALPSYGLPEDALRGIEHPVLVRERLTAVDRPSFAAAANAPAVAQMSPVEHALGDAERLPASAVAGMTVPEGASLQQTLRQAANRPLQRAFIGAIPENERGALLDAQGNLNAAGLERLKAALLARTYPGAAGQRLAAAFVEALDPGVWTIEQGVEASLPAMARAEALIGAGERDASLSLADDLAQAIDVYARLKQGRLRVGDYLSQGALWDRETTPLQDRLLGYLDANARSPRQIRAMIEEYARAVEAQPAATAADLFGDAPRATKEGLLDEVFSRLGHDAEGAAQAGADLGGVGASGPELAGAARRQVPPAGAAAGAPAGGGAGASLAEDAARIDQAQADLRQIEARLAAGEGDPLTQRALTAEAERLRAVVAGQERAPAPATTALPGTADAGGRFGPPVAEPPRAPADGGAGRIRGFGHYDPEATSGGAAGRLAFERADYEAGALRTVPMEETARRAEEVLGADPERVRQWQQAQLAEGTEGRAVQSEAMRQQAYADAEAAQHALTRLDDAQLRLREASQGGPPDAATQLEVADALLEAAETRQRLQTSALASTAEGTATARALAQRRYQVAARQAYVTAERARALGREAQAAAQEAGRAAESGGNLTERGRRRLQGIRDRLAGPDGEALTPGAADERLGQIEQGQQQARQGRGGRGGQPAEGAATQPREPSFAERLGQLKRARGVAEDLGDTERVRQLDGQIGGLLDEIRADAAERAAQIAQREGRALTQEEAERAVNEAVGRRDVNRIRREAVDEATGRTATRLQAQLDRATEQRVLAALQRHEAEAQKLADSLTVQTQRGIERAFEQERRAAVRDEVRSMADEARQWMDRARRDPANEQLRAELDHHLRVMADHSTLGDVTAKALREQFQALVDEDAFRFTSDLERRIAESSRRESARLKAEADSARMRGLVQQIDEVLANPTAPGAVERFQQLQADLAEVGQAGFARGSAIRQRLAKTGLLRAGLRGATEDVEPLVRALQRVDPDKPEEMRAVLAILSKPRLIDKVLEFQYVNMLSSPVTHAVNATSNALQVAGRLFLHNPLSFVLSGGENTGALAAFGGAARGLREGLGEAGQIMRSGISEASINRAVELGDYSRINREVLTERYGKLGAILHMLSTRPLEAADALLGHVAYAAAAEQQAQRLADQMLRAGRAEVKGMDRVAAKEHILANVWDYPEIVERAGKIKDYTLLRSRDVEGNGWGRVERWLRQGAALRTPAEDAGAGGQIVAFLANDLMPFFGVPLNFAKQGAERTVGVPVNAVRGIRAGLRGDREQQGELLAKAAIGASGLTLASVLAAGDNLTGDGPSDPGQRRVWEMTHQRNSVRIPGTDQWISYDGTPLAIPFALVANAAENVREARARSEKQGISDAVETGGALATGAARGAVQGFLSQSFVKALADQYGLLTGQDTSMSMVANRAANTLTRWIPAGGMLNFLGRLGDGMQRDLGRPRQYAELPGAVAQRVEARLPGARTALPEKLGIYGEGMPNEQRFPLGAVPSYRGRAPGAGDPITQRLDEAHVGMPSPPDTLAFRGMDIPLTQAEQRTFQQAWGQAFRRNLEGMQRAGKAYPDQSYTLARDEARKEAVAAVLRTLPPDEIRRRVEARQAAGAR